MEIEKVIIDELEAQTLQRDYVCAGCWGNLLLFNTPGGKARVACGRCGDGRGFVRKNWSDRQRQQNMVDARDVKRTLQKIGILKRLSQTEAELLHKMGF